MALNPPHSPPRVPPLARGVREGCLEFILERVLHDFANAIGGILALSHHHLQNDALEDGISASLALISESAEHCRHLLSVAATALEEGSPDWELIPVSELCVEVQRFLQALLPRSVDWEAGSPDTDGLVRVPLTEFKHRCLALVSMDLEQATQNRASITMTYAVRAGTCWFSYRTSNVHDSSFAAAAGELMLPLALTPDRVRCTPATTGFTVEFGFPLESQT